MRLEVYKRIVYERVDCEAGDGLDLRYPNRAPSQSSHKGHGTSGKRGGIAQARDAVSQHECEGVVGGAFVFKPC